MEFYGHNLLGRLCKKKEDRANQDKVDKDKLAKKDKSDVAQQDKSDGAKKGKTDGAKKDKRKQDKGDKKDKRKHKKKTNGDVTGRYLAGHMVKTNSILAPYKNRSRRRTRSNGKDDAQIAAEGSEVNSWHGMA